MPRRANAYLRTRRLAPSRPLALAATALALLVAPAVGTAASGGAGVGPSAHGSAQPADGTVSSTVDGMTISTRASGFYRQGMSFSGVVGRRDRGQTIVIERSGRQTGGAWVATARSKVGWKGGFRAHWQADHAGSFAFRAVLQSTHSARDASAWPTVNVIVYRLSTATYYGPGFWGSRTACGQTLRHRTLGVANRTLPCGTRVSIYYQGRSIVVPVIDRGPYANGANWDLTEATARALHMSGTATVGAARVSSG